MITAFDAVHDAVDPKALLIAIRQALKPGGRFLWGEFNVGSSLQDNLGNPLAKLIYPVSLLHCIPVSLAEGGHGLGAVLGEDTARELARDAGYSSFAKLPIAGPVQTIYELEPRAS